MTHTDYAIVAFFVIVLFVVYIRVLFDAEVRRLRPPRPRNLKDITDRNAQKTFKRMKRAMAEKRRDAC